MEKGQQTQKELQEIYTYVNRVTSSFESNRFSSSQNPEHRRLDTNFDIINSGVPDIG